MKKFVYCAATAVAIYAMPLSLYAAEPNLPGLPKPELLFKHLDANEDGNLTIDEFVAGMNQLHETKVKHREPLGPAPGHPRTPPPIFGAMMPPPMFPFPPSMPGFGMPPGGMHGPRLSGPMPAAGGDRGLPQSLVARLEALEEKLNAIEAELQGD
ncbi:MAG: hypothetical protein K8T91_18640 [Planctomycetes bacterium]|nr:hypothetical protein [Planctomycetota bacterium]